MTKALEAALKPCPLCGGPASYHDRGYAEISCDDCGVEITDGTPYRESVAEAWNRRALLERDALREALEKIRKLTQGRGLDTIKRQVWDIAHHALIARAALSQKEKTDADDS